MESSALAILFLIFSLNHGKNISTVATTNDQNKALIFRIQLNDQLQTTCAIQNNLTKGENQNANSWLDLINNVITTDDDTKIDNSIKLSNISIRASSEMNERGIGKTTFINGTPSNSSCDVTVFDTDGYEPYFTVVLHLTRSNTTRHLTLKTQWKVQYLSPFQSSGYKETVLDQWSSMWPEGSLSHNASIMFATYGPNYTEFGNYSLTVIRAEQNRTVFLQNFEYDLKSPVEYGSVSVYFWNKNVTVEEATLEHFDGILNEKEIDQYNSFFQVNKTYLLLCQYIGNNFEAEKAFLYWTPKNCSNFDLSTCLAPITASSPNTNRLLPTGVGKQKYILGMAVVARETINYGCGYNNSEPPKLSRPFVVSDSPNGKGIYATIAKSTMDKTELENQPRLRCVINDFLYGRVYKWITPRGVEISSDATPAEGFNISLTRGGNSVYFDLIILNDDKENAGEYYCQASKLKWKSKMRLPATSDPTIYESSNFANVTEQLLKNSKNKETAAGQSQLWKNQKATETKNIVMIAFGFLFVGLVAIAFAVMATRVYNTRIKKKQLKEFEKTFRNQNQNLIAKAYLNPLKPINDQSEQLHFDPDFEMSKNTILETSRKLGDGNFGKVYLAFFKKDDQKLKVACKMPADGMNYEHQKCLIREMKLMAHLGRHVNVLCLLGAVTEEMSNGKLCAILEYCEFGSLKDYVLQRKNNFLQAFLLQGLTGTTERHQVASLYSQVIDNKRDVANAYQSPILIEGDECLSVLDLLSFGYQIANGVEFLSSKHVIHRDLALRNMLLNGLYIVKVADFGLARRDQVSKNQNQGLPLAWMALEAILDGEYGTESDVWSYGVVLWELFSLGSHPYPGYQQPSALIDYLKGEGRLQAPDHCPENVYALMRQCWDVKKCNRPSFAECKAKLAGVALSISSSYWNNLLKHLETVSHELTNPSGYYNLKQPLAHEDSNCSAETDITTAPDYVALVQNPDYFVTCNAYGSTIY